MAAAALPCTLAYMGRGRAKVGLGTAATLALALLLTVTSPACALDVSRPLESFRLVEWGPRDGAPVSVNSLAQSPDGFLWIGGGQGLTRFDGLTFEPIEPLSGRKYSPQVDTVFAARNGDIWVGHDWGGVSVVRHGRWQEDNYPDPIGTVTAIGEDGEGGVWVLADGKQSRLMHHGPRGWDPPVDDGLIAQLHVQDMMVSRTGAVWLSAPNALYVLDPHARHFRLAGGKSTSFGHLAEDAEGCVWVVNEGVVVLEPGARHARVVISPKALGFTGGAFARDIMFDRDGALWIADRSEVVRITNPRRLLAGDPPRLERRHINKGFMGDAIKLFLQDREGGLWVAAAEGLNRFSDSPIAPDPTVTTQTELFSWRSSRGELFVAADHRLLRLERDGRWTQALLARSPDLLKLSSEFSHMCDAPDGQLYFASGRDLWALTRRGAKRLSAVGAGERIERCAVDGQGRLWLSVPHVGQLRSDDGGRTFKAQPVLPEDPHRWAWILSRDGRGRLIAYFGLSRLMRLEGDHWVSLAENKDMAVGLIRAIYAVGDVQYLCGDFGLARIVDGHLQFLSADAYPFLRRTNAILQTSQGETWLLAGAGLVQVASKDLEAAFAQPGRPLAATVFDRHQGLPAPMEGSVPDTTKLMAAPDGRIAIVAHDQLAWFDPIAVHRAAPSPRVIIRAIAADNRNLASGASALDLPAGTSRLKIDFSAPSFANPDHVRVRYRLEGFDPDWVEARAEREAVYTNLKPGRYRFRVIAASDEGAWNREGASLDLRLRPTFVQSPLFGAVVIVAVALLAFGAYALRLRFLAERMRERLEERVAERERIARELHDTLLQGFQGLMLRFQAVLERIPPAGQDTRRLLEDALDRADRVLVEGRDRVRNLRGAEARASLADSLRGLVGQTWDPAAAPVVEIRIEGEPRPLHAVAHQEICRIVEEALRNVALHAQARTVVVEARFGPRTLRVCITDDGVGITPEVRDVGRAGRFGLTGMRERALRLRGAVALASQPQGGTEVMISVPARVAYAPRTRRPAWLPRLAGRATVFEV
jgi:signal transduction histidine kinase/streptogramin lyase